MATITTDTYLDGGTSRTAGETWTINSGAIFTIRTDTRWHANAPASMTGSLGSQTINEGKILYDGRNVRWLPYNSGSGNVPAIGTNITQAGVSASYLLGVYASLTSAPTAVGSAMPTSGFIKFREVTGAFASGALTGIGASATGADVTGWIEVVADDASTITVPRLGEHEIRGDWFYLDNTTGVVGQQIQIPTNGGGAGTYSPGVWVETSPGSNQYEYWPALNGATNGWAKQHLGGAYSETDKRQNFVKAVAGGLVQFGEAFDVSGTYANVTAQASTYASLSHSCTYTWVADKVTVYYSTGHLLKTGQQVGLDFTSGGATANDGIYTITVIDAYYYTIDLIGSGASGNVTARPGVTVTFTAHTLGVGDTVYCDFTTGTGVDGDYEIYAVTSANGYLIKYPHVTALTSGNVSVHSRYTITATAHGLALGNRVYLDFTSGAGVDGIYTIVGVATDTFDIVMNNNGSADSGNVTIKQTIGNIPTSGCKVRIPNVILRGCATGTRASNFVNATLTSRPEWSTTTAGAIDIEYAYMTWFPTFSQAYSVKLYNTSIFDNLTISECASAVDINDTHTSMHSGLDAISLSFQSNFAGGVVQNCKFMRGNTPGVLDHAVSIAYCIGTSFINVEAGIIQFTRTTGKAFYLANCTNLTFTSCRSINSHIELLGSFDIYINNYDHVDRFIGYTNATAAYYAVHTGIGCSNINVDGMTFGYSNTIPNVHPYNGMVYYTVSNNCTFRNLGTYASPLPCGSWRQNLYSLGLTHASGGNCSNIILQRIYIDNNSRTGIFATQNSDKNILLESVNSGMYVMSAMAISSYVNALLNATVKGCFFPNNSVTGQASVYGTHFSDFFLGTGYGRVLLAMNEPTTDTATYFTMVNGTQKYNSAGGILMGVIGDQAIWETPYFIKGHTGFVNVAPTMSGGTIGNYTLEYQIDTGSGWNGTWTTLNGTNLSAETVNPATGFKLKIRITTTSTNSTAITYLRLDTTTSASAQSDNLYPLDTISLTLTGLLSGSDVVIYEAGTETVLDSVDAVSAYSYIYETPVDIDIAVFKAGYIPYFIRNYSLTSNDASLPVSQVVDRAYLE